MIALAAPIAPTAVDTAAVNLLLRSDWECRHRGLLLGTPVTVDGVPRTVVDAYGSDTRYGDVRVHLRSDAGDVITVEARHLPRPTP